MTTHVTVMHEASALDVVSAQQGRKCRCGALRKRSVYLPYGWLSELRATRRGLRCVRLLRGLARVLGVPP